MTLNQFTIFKAGKLNCDPEFIKMIEENTEFITDKKDIFEFFN